MDNGLPNDSNARAVYSWESQYLGQVTTRYLLPVSHLRPRLYVEMLSGVLGFSRPERQRFINLRSARRVPRLDRSPFRRQETIVSPHKHFESMCDRSLRKQPFLLALRRWGRFARRNVCDSATEIPYWWRKICPESGHKRWLDDRVVTLF